MFNLDHAVVNIICPRCSYGISVELIDIRLEGRIICHNCKADIQLREESASVHSSQRNINTALNNLFRNLKV